MQIHSFLKTAFTFSFVFCITAAAQTNCDFKIDTFRILSNKNLDNLLAQFQHDTFKITNNNKDIPAFIKQQLDCLTHGFSLANPGEPYQATDMVFKKLPYRKLVFLAKSNSMLVITYLKGGIATSRHVLLIKYRDTKITDLWTGNCVNGMDTRQGIINSLTNNRNKAGVLNGKAIYF